jgi:hypothetical protein
MGFALKRAAFLLPAQAKGFGRDGRGAILTDALASRHGSLLAGGDVLLVQLVPAHARGVILHLLQR